ncbi:hypothetical protein CDD82_7443 [Ophiocordyceps australis]|uniref:Uncharacterized protein n=1 Tax=Ophiocordyceps australis TaxID=1399860 RepID=A0A2C5ZPN1_9HYPO|nr:hypothetical protein CDD82_7443 [Ophiocordyceps australis]
MKAFIFLPLLDLVASKQVANHFVLPNLGNHLDSNVLFPGTGPLPLDVISRQLEYELDSDKKQPEEPGPSSWWKWVRPARNRGFRFRSVAQTMKEMNKTGATSEATMSACTTLLSLIQAMQKEPPRPPKIRKRRIALEDVSRIKHALQVFGKQCPMIQSHKGLHVLEPTESDIYRALKKREKKWQQWKTLVTAKAYELNDIRVKIRAMMDQDPLYEPHELECAALFDLIEARTHEPMRPKRFDADIVFALDKTIEKGVALFGKQCGESAKLGTESAFMTTKARTP